MYCYVVFVVRIMYDSCDDMRCQCRDGLRDVRLSGARYVRRAYAMMMMIALRLCVGAGAIG